MKNIAFIINSLAVGGNERSVSLLSEVISKNYIVYIIVFDGSHIAYNYDGELIDINEPSRTGIFNKILVYIRRIKKVNKIIKDKQIDIIYAFTNSFNAISHWRFHNVKKIVACRDCGDLIRKTSCYAHMLKTSDHMVFNSEFMRTYFLGKYPQYNDKCSVIYNIVDTHYIESVCSEKLSPEHEQFYKTHAVVVAVGRFCKEKGFNHLVRSFVMLRDIIPSAGLVIVGNGELFPLIEKMVSVCKYKDDILLVGAQKNPYKYMMLAKVFALSSITEGFPNVLLEAMACGLPVVATDCTSGPREILANDTNYDTPVSGFIASEYGVLCERFTPDDNYVTMSANDAEKSMFQGLMYLLNNNSAREEYTARSKKRVLSYDAQIASNALVDIFKKL